MPKLLKKSTLLLLVFLYAQSLFSQNNESMTRAVNWLQEKLSYYETERYKTGEIYSEYEVKVSFDYNSFDLIYEVDKKGLSDNDHHKYIIPLKYIDPGRLAIERNKCCENSEFYNEIDEAEVHLYTFKNRKVIRLALIDKDGEAYELEYKKNKVRLLIPTSVNKSYENLPQKCVKVLELLISLCSE